MRDTTRLLMILVALVVVGCAPPPKSTLRGDDRAVRTASERAVGPSSAEQLAKQLGPQQLGPEIVRVARGYLGAPYRFAARGPEAFDCSGLVQRSYAAVGVRVPRTSAQLARVGRAVSPDALQPGDLVLFANTRGTIDHVGIFSGRGRFLHASSSRGVVEDALGSSWFRQRFAGARRILEP